MITKSLFAGIAIFMIASASMVHAVPGDDLYKTQRGLQLQDTVTTLPIPVTQANYFAIETGFYISGSQSCFVDDYFLTGYTNLDSPGTVNPVGPFFAPVTIYDTRNGTLDFVDSLNLKGLGVETTAISAVPTRPFIVVSTFKGGVDDLFGNFGPYILKVYAYNPVTGTIVKNGPDPVEKSSFDFTSLSTGNPNTAYANSDVISYNAVVNFTHDSKYVFYTTSVSPVGDNPVPAVIKQRFGVLAIDENGVINPTPVAEIDTPAPNTPNFFFYAQPDVQTIEYPEGSGNYKFLVTFGSFFPATNAALSIVTQFIDSIVVTYDFSPNKPLAERLVPTGHAQLPQLVRAGHFNAQDNLLAVITTGVIDGPSIRIGAQNAFLGADDPKSELRIYKFDPTVTHEQFEAHTANALSYIAGHHINGDGWNIKWSNDHSMLALTMTQLNRLMVPTPPQLPTSLRANAPSMLYLYTVKNNGTRVFLEDVQPVAPAALNLSWSNNDKYVAVTGRPTPQFHDAAIFEVVDFKH